MSLGTVRRRPATTAVLCLLLAACGDDDPTGNDATLLGSWEATSFIALGTDLVADGMGFDLTLAESGTYTIQVSDDQVGVCEEEGQTSCQDSGTFTYTASEVTLDPGEEGEVTFDYTVSQAEMTWVGLIGGFPVTVTFARR